MASITPLEPIDTAPGDRLPATKPIAFFDVSHDESSPGVSLGGYLELLKDAQRGNAHERHGRP